MPVNNAQFLAGVPSPVDRIQEGVVAGQTNQLNTQQIAQNDVILENQQAAQQAAKAAAQRKTAMNEALVGIVNNPNKTSKDFIDFQLQYPEMAEQLKAPLDQMDSAQRSASLNEMINVKAAIANGETGVAIGIMEDRKTAAENSGDQAGVDQADAIIRTMKINPEAVGSMIDMSLAANDPDNFIDNFGKIKEQRRKSDLDPLNKEKLTVEIAKTRADTTKVLNESGETVAEYKSVTQNPDGSSTGINTLTGKLEVIPVGDEPLPATKAQLDATNKLIDTAKKDKRVNNFIEVSSNNDRITSALDSAAGDISLIFAFMKMLDPGSTVREGEFATAQNSGSVNENVWAAYNKAVTGERLVPSRRADFKNQAKAIFAGSRDTAEKAIAPIKAHAERFNIRGDTIEEAIFGLPNQETQTPTGLPEGTIDNGDGTFTLTDGTVIRAKK
jgi:hypothetical protein